jgi:hypothetical protein
VELKSSDAGYYEAGGLLLLAEAESYADFAAE